jgi:hypothetical protein
MLQRLQMDGIPNVYAESDEQGLPPSAGALEDMPPVAKGKHKGKDKVKAKGKGKCKPAGKGKGKCNDSRNVRRRKKAQKSARAREIADVEAAEPMAVATGFDDELAMQMADIDRMFKARTAKRDEDMIGGNRQALRPTFLIQKDCPDVVDLTFA